MLESVSLLIMGHYHSVNLVLSLVLGLFPVREVDFLYVWTKIWLCSLTFDLASIGRYKGIALFLPQNCITMLWSDLSLFKYY